MLDSIAELCDFFFLNLVKSYSISFVLYYSFLRLDFFCRESSKMKYRFII